MGNDNVEASSSLDSPNVPRNPSTSNDEGNSNSSDNTNMMNNASGSNVNVDCINITLRNPMPPTPVTTPPAPSFSPSTRARILELLNAENLTEIENILEGLAQTIADFHPYLIADDVITIPDSTQININQYTEEMYSNVSTEEMWDHIDIPLQIVVDDDEMSQETVEIFYDASSEEEDGNDGNPASDVVYDGDDEISQEGVLAVEARNGVPKSIRMRNLMIEVYSSNPLIPNSEPQESCRICLEEYEDGHKTVRLECGDMFHYFCINRWLQTKNVCPLCRRPGINL